MGQPLSACCNPNSNLNHEVEIAPFNKDTFALTEGQLQSVSEIKQLDALTEETLIQARKFRNTSTARSSEGSDGLWVVQVRNSEGTLEKIYCKGSLSNNKLEGEFSIYFPKGEIFEGKIVNQQPVEGIFVFKKGCYYVGQISQFNAQGEGRYENQDTGYLYQGTWSKSLPHGKGKQVYKEGESFQGEIMYGQKFGQGIYHFPDGKIYYGSFYYNQSDGKGKITYPDQSFYEGNWKLGKFHGKGLFRWSNGETYQGDYIDGMKHGRGKYTFKNGSWYEGGWQNGLQSGKGVFHQGYDDIEGQWVEGQLQSL